MNTETSNTAGWLKDRPVWLTAFNTPPFTYPPFGLLTVARAWKRHGLSVSVRQLGIDDAADLVNEAVEQEVGLVGMSVTAGPPLAAAVEAGRALRTAGIPVVWGGAMPTTAPWACLSFEAADVVVVGPGEHGTEALLETLNTFCPETRDPLTISLEPPPYETGLETVYPDPSLLDDPAAYLPPRPPFRAVASIPFSRGCRRKCTFCAAPMVANGRVRYDPEDVLCAADFWTRSHGADAVEFADDELLDPRFDVRPLVERIGLPFYAQLHARTVSPEVCRWLKTAGCQAVKMGAESGSNRTLRRIRKGLRADDIVQAAANLLSENIKPVFTFIMGFPDDDMKDIDATVSLAGRLADMDPTVLIRFCHFTPFPGTALWQRSLELGFKPPQDVEDWARLDLRRPVVPWLDHRMARGLVNRLNEEFYFGRVHYLTRQAAGGAVTD